MNLFIVLFILLSTLVLPRPVKAQTDVCATADDICKVATKYNFDCDILRAIQFVETGLDPYDNLNPLEGTPLLYCSFDKGCGPFQVSAGTQVNLGVPLDKFETISGSAEAAVRLMYVRMCQADCRLGIETDQNLCSVCNTTTWDPSLADKYSIGSEDFSKAAYSHYGSDLPTTGTEGRWGKGVSYTDALKLAIKNNSLPDEFYSCGLDKLKVQTFSHPLRPFPGEPIENTDTSFLTPYCASRPTAIQPNSFDKRNENITLTVTGELTSDFSEFITPLLSITNPSKQDYNLKFEQKAKRYLADYLEGRAYYEINPEIQNPNFDQQRQIFSRLGVFRKLTPSTYQDKLKRVLIKRANGDYSSLSQLQEIYGFKPSSIKINPKTPVSYLTLSDFYDHWAPLPEEYQTWEEYERAFDNWANCNPDKTDCSLWYTLWAYIPVFTREDSVGQITAYDEPGQTSEPKTITKVYHPHLARTYETVSSLATLLSPREENLLIKDPFLPSQWITPAPWNQDAYWLDSGQNLAPEQSTVCDPQNPLVLSSGDLALDTQLNTSVDKTLTIANPDYDPTCAVWVDIPYFEEQSGGYWDESNCYFTIDVRFSPTSLKTKTPFLAEITDRLTTGQYPLFNIFKTSEQVTSKPPQNILGIGFEEEENPTYTFSNGPAEAGLKNAGTTAKYFYKYLGYVQCQKEKVLASLLPANTYIPFATECDTIIDGSDDNHNNLIPAADTAVCQTLMDNLNLQQTVIPSDFENTINQIGQDECVDPLILRAVLIIEGNFSASNAGDSFLCQPNACSATGPMQITTGYQCVNCDPSKGLVCQNYCDPNTNQLKDDIIKGALSGHDIFDSWFDYSREGENVCDFTDSVSVAARMLKTKAGVSCLKASDSEAIRTAGNRYHGSSSPVARLGNISYGDYIVNFVNHLQSNSFKSSFQDIFKNLDILK